ncbi:helix-turn-helix domain-containing protein [Asanoa sp. NPDC050611]|uniref:TetR/AcrR family transcriptional regulator n=1 Tax=Asanoa sp. NPDC050611 TaxID=3157098 RepID=UPI0033FB7D39
MGNRESLIAGAKQCLRDVGYTRTTARDIATAAGVSLAAIGYHFGSTRELLNQALMEALAEWGAELATALQATDGSTEAVWTAVIESVRTQRPLWTTQFELAGQVDRLPEIHDFLVAGQRTGRTELAGLFGAAEGEEGRLIGGLAQALLAGLAIQWLIDPDGALTATDLTAALKLAARDRP